MRTIAILAAPTLILSSGCFSGLLEGKSKGYSKKELVKFNQTIVDSNRRLREKGGAFFAALNVEFMSSRIVDKTGNRERLKDHHKAILATVAEVEREMDALDVPDLKSAKRLYESYREFLKGQKRLAEKEFAEILSIIDDPKLHISQKRAKIKVLKGSLVTKERVDFLKLVRAQRIFAEEHKLKLIKQ